MPGPDARAGSSIAAVERWSPDPGDLAAGLPEDELRPLDRWAVARVAQLVEAAC